MEEIYNEDYLSDSEEEEIVLENKNIYFSHEINVIKKFNIYFYFDFNRSRKYVLPINTDSFKVNNYHVYDLIKYIVKKINDSNIVIKEENINYSVSLKDIDEEEENMEFYINNYELKPFENKNNYSIYQSTDSLKTINEENITFVSKDPLNIMLIKQY